MSYLINTPITGTFIIRDNAGTAVTGLSAGSFTPLEAYSLPAAAATATPTITEIGGGEYAYSFTPTTNATWTFHALYSSGGVFREISEVFQVDLTSSTVIVVGGVSGSAGVTKTFAELIRLLADEFGDLLILTATALGTTTTMIDTKHINIGAENMDGRELTFIDGVNAGLTRRITSCTDTTGTITFAAVTGAVAAGTVADVLNYHAVGFLRDEYKRFINRAIDAAAGVAKIELLGTIAAEFSTTTREIIVPAAIKEVFKVEWQDSGDGWNEIKRASRWGAPGWTALKGSGVIRVEGAPSSYANGRVVQVWGYGRQEALVDDDDTCSVNAEWIIAHAAYHMAKANLKRKPELGNLVLDWKDSMNRLSGRLRRSRHPDTQAVR